MKNQPASTALPAAPAESYFEKADFLCSVIVLGVCIAIALPRFRIGIDWSDEGFLAYGAARVMEGQIPNRDFVSLQPPMSFYALAGVFGVLGTSLRSLRLWGLCLYTLIAVVLYAIARHRAPPLTAIAAALPATILGMPFFNFVPFAVWLGMANALLAVLCLMRAVDTNRTAWIVGSGLFTAATLLSRHDQGAYLVLATLIYFVALWVLPRENHKPVVTKLLFGWSSALLAPLVLLIAYWYAVGAGPHIYRQLVLFPLTTYAKTSSLPMPVLSFDIPLEAIVQTMLFYLPPVLYSANIVYLVVLYSRRRAGAQWAQLLFIQAFAALFYAQVLVRSDVHHLLITLPPFFIISAWTLHTLLAWLGTRFRPMAPIPWKRSFSGFGALAITLIAGSFITAILHPVLLRDPRTSTTMLAEPRGGIRVDQTTGKVLNELVGIIHTHAEPQRSILSLPYAPMFYFLADRRNPTRWNYLHPGDQTEQDHRALIDQAKSDPPDVITIMGEGELETYAKTIVDYVRADYRLQYHTDILDMNIYVRAERNVNPD